MGFPTKKIKILGGLHTFTGRLELAIAQLGPEPVQTGLRKSLPENMCSVSDVPEDFIKDLDLRQVKVCFAKYLFASKMSNMTWNSYFQGSRGKSNSLPPTTGEVRVIECMEGNNRLSLILSHHDIDHGNSLLAISRQIHCSLIVVVCGV